MKNLYFMILFHLIVAKPQINLYFTNRVGDNATRHNCLRVAAFITESNINRQIISYCISESLLKYNIQKNDHFPKYTFTDLSKQNITSQQLYLWSASIDIIEDYQLYLNQLLISNHSSLGTKVFYNCTLPRFGSQCEYELDYFHPNHSSLLHIIHDFYYYNEYQPTNMTCYTHLKCDRGPLPSCLDWSEICDGDIDCYNGNFDEEHCWQLEINECKDNEYRCTNGQCIPKSFYQDGSDIPDCLDQSDEHPRQYRMHGDCKKGEPSFGCEDVTCKRESLTSSCVKQRTELLADTLYSIKDKSVSNDCWSTFKCFTSMSYSDGTICDDICKDKIYVNITNLLCPDTVFMPTTPVLFHDIYFAYRKNDLQYFDCPGYGIPYICYNNSRYDEFFVNETKLIFNNITCYRSIYHVPVQAFIYISWPGRYLEPLYRALKSYNLVLNYTSAICNRSNMYQCNSSPRCISIYRLLDDIDDCPNRDDENLIEIKNTHVVEWIKQNYYKCYGSNKYLPQSFIANRECDCEYIESGWCEDEDLHVNYIKRNISFQTICDGFIELAPILIDGQNQTDETECEQWPCSNIYTHCDGIWNCPNGADEVGCYSSPLLNCSSNEHLCVSPDTNQLICLSINKANDGNIDCIGATDESNLCRSNDTTYHYYNFYCMTNSSNSCLQMYDLCDIEKKCVYGDDEQFCNQNRTLPIFNSVCSTSYSSIRLDIEDFICQSMIFRDKKQIIHFSMDAIETSAKEQPDNMENTKFPPLLSTENSQQPSMRCHRGLNLRLWLNSTNNLANTCLCPPSFYGDQCQYQNERVSLSIQFRASSNSWQIPFAIIISLIDNDGIIHSYEQFSYLSMRDCQIKFNIYLLYSTKPKDPTKSYSIRIDIYEKVSLGYRGSLLFPINFSFLPVHRLAFIVDIPRDNDTIKNCTNDQCIKYSNNPHNCSCSSDSLCLGVTSNNRSICICPLHRFGPRCLLIDTACSIYGNSTCENGGQCIPHDEYIESDQKFTCICPKGFIGKRCEIIENKIIVSFDKNIKLPQSIFIHFIQIMNNHPPRRATTFRTIPFKQDSTVIHWPQPFHLVFIELLKKNYYLIVVQKNYNQSITISKSINPSDRCLNISEIFNESIVKLHLVRRIKYYHLPCQIRHPSNLSCFYDNIHLCYCQQHGQQRVANCFEFIHNQKFDCLGQSVCENDAQCFQDTANCPQRSMCICSSCYYGSRCQFSTSGFSLSLDAILGYHIQPHVTLTQQPIIVQTSAALVIIFTIVGLVNGILSLITFKNKNVLDAGCGYYLLCTSFTTLLTTTMFGLKFWILLLAQMELITNRSFLSFQCYSIDFLLRIALNMDQWLNACVAVEQATNAIKGIEFNKKKSIRIAKLIIIILLIVIICTGLDDPISRRLIDEENEGEKRIWCIASYSFGVQTFNWTMNIFHFIVPFIFNLISAMILIKKKSHQLSHIQSNRSFEQILRQQIRQHKNLFIAPIIFVIIALPHLFISFASKCMKSLDDTWLYLIGYFISFIPPMLTFVVFVLPSTFYKKQFQNSMIQYRTYVRRR